MKQWCLVLMLSSALPMSGCAMFTSPARQHALEPDTTYWFDYTADRRGALMAQRGSDMVYCAEPSPDVALDLVSSMNLEADLPQDAASAKIASETRQEVVQLAKRSQMLLFLRESLYRLCELSINQDLSPEEVVRQYEMVIKTAHELAMVEMKEAEQGVLKAQAELIQIKREVTDILDEGEGAGSRP